MSDILTPGFQSSQVLSSLKTSVDNLSADAKAKILKQVNGIFEFVITNNDKKTETFTIDLKKSAEIIKGKGTQKPDATITINDTDFVQLSSGKLNGQKAYMTGKLKVKGQVMLATKLDTVFKQLGDKNSKI